MPQKLHVAPVGLGFGSCFAEIYQHHPELDDIRAVIAARRRSGKN